MGRGHSARLQRRAAVQVRDFAVQAELGEYEQVVQLGQHRLRPDRIRALVGADFDPVLLYGEDAFAGIVQLVNAALLLDVDAVARRDDFGREIEAVGIALFGVLAGVGVDDEDVRLRVAEGRTRRRRGRADAEG